MTAKAPRSLFMGLPSSYAGEHRQEHVEDFVFLLLLPPLLLLLLLWPLATFENNVSVLTCSTASVTQRLTPPLRGWSL